MQPPELHKAFPFTMVQLQLTTNKIKILLSIPEFRIPCPASNAP